MMHMMSLCEKKVSKYLCRISSFYRSSHRRHSAKDMFLKNSQYSHRKTTVLESFSKGFIQICNFIKRSLQYWYFLVNTAKVLIKHTLKKICKHCLFYEKEYGWRLNNSPSKKLLNQWKLWVLNFKLTLKKNSKKIHANLNR